MRNFFLDVPTEAHRRKDLPERGFNTWRALLTSVTSISRTTLLFPLSTRKDLILISSDTKHKCGKKHNLISFLVKEAKNSDISCAFSNKKAVLRTILLATDILVSRRESCTFVRNYVIYIRHRSYFGGAT